MKRKILCILMTAIMLLNLTAAGVYATDEPELIYIDITRGSVYFNTKSISGYDINGNSLNKYDPSAIYVITGNSTNTNIVVNTGTHNIALDNCNIDLSARSNSGAFHIKNTSTVNLSVLSDSTLKSGSNYAGILVAINATLNIVESPTDTSGTLNVYGGESAAGIGANKNQSGGKINIYYGTVNAYGGADASGIGASTSLKSFTSVLISGESTVVNTTGYYGAINSTNTTVKSGATVNAECSTAANTLAGGSITIKDSVVTAKATGSGAAINAQNLYISSSTVTAEATSKEAIGGLSGYREGKVSVYDSNITVISDKSYGIRSYKISFNDCDITAQTPETFSIINGSDVNFTNCRFNIISGQKPSSAKYSSFIYFNKIGTYYGTDNLSFIHTIPDGHTLIINEDQNIKIEQGADILEGNGTLIVKGSIYYLGTVDGTLNGEPIIDNFALIKDGVVTWYSTFDAAYVALGISGAKDITLKLFADATETVRPFPGKNFTIDLNGYSLTYGSNGPNVTAGKEVTFTNSSPEKSKLSISGYSGSHFNTVTNKGTLTFSGNVEISFSIINDGGKLTFKGVSNKYMTSAYYSDITNKNGGVVNLDYAYIFVNSQIINNVGCTLNMTNGASVSTEITFPTILNYGTVNADNFYAYGYSGAIKNAGGVLNLKNGKVRTTYDNALSTSGNTYIENCNIGSSYEGNGIGASGILTIINSTVSAPNKSIGISFNGQELTVKNCKVYQRYGSSLHIKSGKATVTDSEFYSSDYRYGCAISNAGETTIDNCTLQGFCGLSNTGTITVINSTVKTNNNYLGEYAIYNSGTLRFENGIIKGASTAYLDSYGTAEFKNATITGYDFSWSYDPSDLYGKEATFYMTGGTVKLYDTTLPEGFYVVTDGECETKYAVSDLIADSYCLYKSEDNSVVSLEEDDTMLDGQYYTAEKKLPDFGSSIDGINESNVTSADKQLIADTRAEAEEYVPNNYDEATAADIVNTINKCDTLTEKIEEIQQQIAQIAQTSQYTQNTSLTTDDITRISSAVAQANALLASENLTESERTQVAGDKTVLEAKLNELENLEQKIEKIVEAAKAFETAPPTTAEAESVQTLINDINELLNQNQTLTQEEIRQLNEAKTVSLAILEDFEDTKDQLSELETKFKQINRSRVNIFDLNALETLKEETDSLIAHGTLGGNEAAKAQRLSDSVQSLINLVNQPYFYGIIRVFWTVISLFKAIVK